MLRLLINLDRSPDRLDKFNSVFLKKFGSGLSYTRIQAVDGKTLTQDQIQALLPSLNSSLKIDFLGQLTTGEIGCFLSHRKCWQALLASNEEWCLIMEDDIEFSDNARWFVESDSWIPNGIGIVQLHTMCENATALFDKNSIPLTCDDRKLVSQLKPVPIGTQAYFICRDAARKALELSEKLPAPVDDFLFQPYSTFRQSYKTWTLYPAVIRPTPNTSSSIGEEVRHRKRKKSVLLHFHPKRLWRKVLRKWSSTFNGRKAVISFR